MLKKQASEDHMANPKGLAPPMVPFIYPALQRSIDTLNTLIKGPDKLHLVVGDAGSGKTTFLKAFLSNVADTWNRCRIRIRVPPSRQKAGGVATCQAIQIEHHPLPVFILEDVHRLHIHALGRLLQKGRRSWNALDAKALIMVGQRDLVRMLEHIADKMLSVNALNTLYVPPLKEDEVIDYIHHRFKHHPLLPLLSLKPRHVKTIHQSTGGMPAHINQFVVELLAASERSQKQRVNNGVAYQMKKWLGLTPPRNGHARRSPVTSNRIASTHPGSIFKLPLPLLVPSERQRAEGSLSKGLS